MNIQNYDSTCSILYILIYDLVVIFLAVFIIIL